MALVAFVLLASGAGTALGFAAGLVPGLHMNNVAAAMSAYVGTSIVGGNVLYSAAAPGEVQLALACLISSAMVAHLFASAITSTYVGVPSEDVVSVLPAHRLARAGLGQLAVRASADGSLHGILLSTSMLAPLCALMGPPVGFFGLLKFLMLPLVLAFVGLLLYSEGKTRSNRNMRKPMLLRILRAAAVFSASGVLGAIVLASGFSSGQICDFPWMEGRIVQRSSLLLPLFAGLFGVPGLLLSLGSRVPASLSSKAVLPVRHSPTWKESSIVLVGGSIVGWMPGMTSGSAVTLCSPRADEVECEDDIAGAVRFIWIYSAISSAGAVFALGALFTILRARSGSMDAIESMMGSRVFEQGFFVNGMSVISLLLAMLVSATVCHLAVTRMNGPLARCGRSLASKKLAYCSLAFVCCLTAYITGTRGLLLMGSAALLGLIPPLTGVRRIQLMGCLLVPMILAMVGR